MKITCVADLHGHYPKLENGDLLIIAGDCTTNDSISSWSEFFIWLGRQKFRKKILVAGNHDGLLSQCIPTEVARELIGMDGDDFEYLCNNGTEFEGFKIWGTPHSLIFDHINPKYAYFMDTEQALEPIYKKIPNDIDILISHSPFKHILDQCADGYCAGSYSLREAVDRIEPKLFICGHIHEQGGKTLIYKYYGPNTLCINASIMDERYKPVNKPIEIEL